MEYVKDLHPYIRAAIKRKLQELGPYVYEELTDYIMVLVANKKNAQQMAEDLSLFMGRNSIKFTLWLHGVLEKLHSVVVVPGLLTAHDLQVDSRVSIGQAGRGGAGSVDSRVSIGQAGRGGAASVELQARPLPSAPSSGADARLSISPTLNYHRNWLTEKSLQVPVEADPRQGGAAAFTSRPGLRGLGAPCALGWPSQGGGDQGSPALVPESTYGYMSSEVPRGVDRPQDSCPAGHSLPGTNKDRRDREEVMRWRQEQRAVRSAELLRTSAGQNSSSGFLPLSGWPAEAVEEEPGAHGEKCTHGVEPGALLPRRSTVTCPSHFLFEERESSSAFMQRKPFAAGPGRRTLATPVGEEARAFTAGRARDGRTSDATLCDERESQRGTGPNFIVTLEGVSNVVWNEEDEGGEDESELYYSDEESEGLGLKRHKAPQRCKFWPVCDSGDQCLYHHPVTQCKTFPHCGFGDKCLFVHPDCKYDAHCTRLDCPYTHRIKRSLTSLNRLDAKLPPDLCHFFPECKKMDCQFYHPKPCRFMTRCKRADCYFYHPPTPSGHAQLGQIPKQAH